MSSHRKIRIAVEGCGHGTLNSIYASIRKSCEIKRWDNGVDLVIIGGDFQAARNEADLMCMAVPAKYREMGDFHEYYSGKRVAPYLTIFVGGNHEASNHLRELYYGGWVAPNIYYMGAANVVRLGGLRIAGLSGIWKGYEYNKPHYERLPFNANEVKSVYHVREYDTRKLLQLRTQVDIGVSHDWPKGVVWKGNWKKLFSRKPFLRADAESGRLGSVAAQLLLDHLKPHHWFSAHLHVKYAAVIEHLESQPPSKKSRNRAPNAGEQIDASDAEIAPDLKKDFVDGTKLSEHHSNGTLEHNEEEIALDLDDDGPTHNEDEIDLAQEEDKKEAEVGNGSLEATESTGAQSIQKNEDEIEIDIDDEYWTDTVFKIGENGLNNLSPSNTVDESLRAQLPAGFHQPSAPKAIQAAPVQPTDIHNTTTRFLALDKCLPRRDFLQLLEIEASHADSESASSAEPLRLSYDPEWLAITRVFANNNANGNPCTCKLPRDKTRGHYIQQIEAEERWVEEHIVRQSKLAVPLDFTVTAPVYDLAQSRENVQNLPREYNNPQTGTFCALLDIPNHFAATEEEIQTRLALAPKILEEEDRFNAPGGRGKGGRGGYRGGHDAAGHRGDHSRSRGRARGWRRGGGGHRSDGDGFRGGYRGGGDGFRGRRPRGRW